MQNKGLIKFFAILFALVSIYQLSFTFVANKVKNDAKAFAAGNSDKEARYLIPLGRKTYLILDLQISTLMRLVISKSIRVLT
jgi:SecD/SecF fusion protein